MNDQGKPVVLQILPALGFGGVERGVIDISKSLKNNGFEPIVVSSGGVLVYQLRDLGIKHISLPVKTKNPIGIFLNIGKLVKVIKENNVDIIHVRSRAPMWSAKAAAKKTGVKVVTTVHGNYSNSLIAKNSFLKRSYNSVMTCADKIIAVSDFISDYVISNFACHKSDASFEKTAEYLTKKIKVIHRGVDLGYFDQDKVSQNRMINLAMSWNVPDDKKVILMPARFTEWKGHRFLIQALKHVQSEFICIMVGSDKGHEGYRKKLEGEIVKAGLEGKVKIVGPCQDMPAAYTVANLVVCPSIRGEAFGRIAIEAQAMSRIIISTNIGGSKETVINGKTGFLVEVDDVENFAKTIDKVLNMSDSEISKFKVAARENVVNNFSNEKMCSETISIYKNLIKA